MRTTARPTTVARQTVSDLVASPVRTAVSALLAALVGAAVVIATSTEVSGVATAWTQQRDAGRFTWVVRTEDPAGIQVSDCDGTAAITGVTAAGGVISTRQATLTQQPGTVINEITASPGYLDLAWPGHPAGASTIAGSELASAGGLVSGAFVDVEARTGIPAPGAAVPVRIDWAATGRSKIDGINGALTRAAAPVGTTSECYVEALPGAAEDVEEALFTWFPPGAVVSDLIPPTALESDPENDLDHRSSRYGWVLGGAFLVVLQLVGWFSRRGDLALYRLLGLRRTGLAVMMTTEVAMSVVAPVLMGISVAIALVPPSEATTARALLADLVRLMSLLTVIPVVGLALGLLSNPVDALRGR